jgi:hypothetical protein
MGARRSALAAVLKCEISSEEVPRAGKRYKRPLYESASFYERNREPEGL